MLSFFALKFSNTFMWPCLGERKRNRKLIQNSLSQHRYVHFPASFSIDRSGKVLHQSKQSHHRISFVMYGSILTAVAVGSRSSECFCLKRERLLFSCDGLCYHSSKLQTDCRLQDRLMDVGLQPSSHLRPAILSCITRVPSLDGKIPSEISTAP